MTLGLLLLIAAPSPLVPAIAAAPDGPWRLEGDGAVIAGEDPVFEVRGTGDDSSAWLADVELEAGALYRLTFDMRGTGSGVCAVTGLTSVNHDVGPTTEWRTYSRLIRVPDADLGGAADVAGSEAPPAGLVTLRFGQWHWRGAIQFRRLHLAPARPVHTGPAGLGDGERILDGEYSFMTDFSSEGASYSRPLDGCRATFNTNRFNLDDAAEVTYRFSCPDIRQTSATLRAQVGYHTSGGLVAEARSSGDDWLEVGQIEGVGSLSADLPPALFPADQVLLRFRTTDGAYLQLHGVEYRAELAAKDASGVGSTLYVEESGGPSPVETQWIAAGPSEIILSFSHDGRRPMGANLEVDLAEETIVDERLVLPPREEVLRAIPLPGTEAGAHPLAVTVRVGPDIVYQGVTTITTSALDVSNYGHGLVSADGGSLWWCDSTRKVSTSRPPAPVAAEPVAPALSAARGEFEALQLVLRPESPVTGVQVSVTHLTGPGGVIDAGSISIEHVEYVNITRRTDPTGVEGEWPDPLPPYDGAFDLTAGRNHPLWIRVHVPYGTPAGEYTGTLSIEAEAGAPPFDERIEVPLSMRVFDFDLPQAQDLTATFGINPSEIWRYHNVWDRAEQEAVWDLYMRNFIEHRIAPYDPMALWPIRLTMEGMEWSAVERDTSNPASGAASAKVTDDTTTGATSVDLLQPKGVDREKPLLVEWSVRTAEEGQSYQVSVMSYDASGSWIPYHNIDVTKQGGTEWQRDRLQIEPGTLHQDARAVTLVLRPTPWTEAGERTGTAWFDDLYLCEPAGANLLTDAGFEPSEGLPTPVLDFDEWDRAAERYIDEMGMAAFSIAIQGMGTGTFHSRQLGQLGGYTAGTPEYERIFSAYVGQIRQHLAEKGWLDKAFVYWFDEPEPKDYEFVIDGMDRLARHAPGLRRMLTEQVEQELIGYVDVWCPLTPQLESDLTDDRMAAGDTFWWYVCTGPKAPWATLFIDHPATELRVWSWQTYQHGVRGLLVWATNYWTSGAAYPDQPQNPWEDPMSYVSGYSFQAGDVGYWGNGDGRFIYPPNRDPLDTETKYLTGPVNSLRWEMLRDGIEDYEYLRILEGLAVAANDAEALALLEIPEEISASLTQFATDSTPIYEHRLKVAEAIERLSR
ncbi:MAG: DUF4091 domain-containing protein [candidate division WS1 bacterium]|jgi:hypothetical protein|nr:DUF4091 domain-containing protein [candidate division WS1 bacterium]